jgi:hypothetical protein
MVLGTNTACSMFCDGLNGQTVGPPYFCTLPSDYLAAFNAAQSDGGTPSTDGGPTCPTWQGNVVVQCGYQCLGRRTDGIADPEHASGTDEGLGATFAERAYLEAVSVHAFARLERELAAQGAPAVLLRDVRRARRDEIRHAAMMARLARRYGWAPTLPEAPLDIQVREAFAIARENAVEGCVRETYGAVVGLVEARGSRDPEVRRAMESISADECRHAELSWAIAAWMRPRLTTGEREAIDRAMQDAIARLARDGDSRLVELLTERVWRQPPVAA